MAWSEERRALVLTLAGGATAIGALLAWLGFFSEPPPAAPARAAARVALRLGEARGRVVDARTGEGLAGARLELAGVDARSDHWFDAPPDAPPGSFALHGLPAGLPATLVVAHDGHVPRELPLAVAPGALQELGDVALVPLAVVTGLVVDPAGERIAGACVELAAGDGSVVPLVCDAFGTFRSPPLAPAKFTLVAAGPQGEETARPTELDATHGGEQPALELELLPACALVAARMLPQPPDAADGAARLRVRVTRPDGEPAAGAALACATGDGAATIVVRRFASAAGRCRVGGFAPGAEVTVSAQLGEERGDATVTMPAEGLAEVTLVLLPPPAPEPAPPEPATSEPAPPDDGTRR